MSGTGQRDGGLKGIKGRTAGWRGRGPILTKETYRSTRGHPQLIF